MTINENVAEGLETLRLIRIVANTNTNSGTAGRTISKYERHTTIGYLFWRNTMGYFPKRQNRRRRPHECSSEFM